MNNIEDIIEKVAENDIDIPIRVENRINYTLKSKNNKGNKHYFKKIVTAIISILCTMIGSLSVYATFGGTINGKPVIEWLGISFSSNYDEYKENVENQQVSYDETTIDLVSTVSDDGFTIFEFDVKVSDKDREYLRLGESVITEADWEIAKKGYESGSRSNAKEQGIPFEETSEYKMLNKSKDIKNTIELEFDNQAENYKINNIFIDDVGYYSKSIQTTNTIDYNEYKVYQLYLLTDEMLNGKEDFKVTLKNIVLKNRANYKKEGNETMYLANTPNNEKSMNIGGEVTTNVSKKKTAEDSKIIDNVNQEIKYKKMTEKIEKISKTPIQTVIKISKIYNNISSQDMSTQDKDYIGVEDYIVKENNGNEIPSVLFETKRVITYSNGKQEEWAPGDIGTYKSFSNAKLETIEYLIIEHRDNISGLKIVPKIQEINFNNTENLYNWKEIGEYNIDISE